METVILWITSAQMHTSIFSVWDIVKYCYTYRCKKNKTYYRVIMSVVASQITGGSIVCSTVSPCVDQRKYQSSAPLAFVRGIHRWQVDSPHKGRVTRKSFHWLTSSWHKKSFHGMFSYIYGGGGGVVGVVVLIKKKQQKSKRIIICSAGVVLQYHGRFSFVASEALFLPTKIR